MFRQIKESFQNMRREARLLLVVLGIASIKCFPYEVVQGYVALVVLLAIAYLLKLGVGFYGVLKNTKIIPKK